MAANYSPLGAFQSGMVNYDLQQARIRRMGLSERQLELNRYLSFYATTQYDSRQVTWDGRKVLSPIERESIARSTVMPMGFYDPGGMFDEMPLSMRLPVAPYHLVRVVVNRFTGLLFAAGKHPQVRAAGDPQLQSWVEGLVSAARLWIRLAHARCLGGAMGSVGVSFRFRNGKPLIEAHDPRWCTPEFLDVATGEISALEIRYQYPREVRRPDGILDTEPYWYRRTIDEEQDIVYAPAPVGEGDEPLWQVQSGGAHGCGECPAVWIRNTPTQECDGEPDCLGIFEAQEAIDRLLSQADQGAVENADPTLGIFSDDWKQDSVKKGSRNALKAEKGAASQYIEMSGTGVDTALKVADVHRRNALEVAQIILDSEINEGTMTATEVERRYSPMHERGDLFREQYGESGAKPLLGKIIRAIIAMRSAVNMDPATGLRLVPQVVLPPAVRPGQPPAPREMPAGLTSFSDDQLELAWPEWIKRGPSDAQSASGAVASARTARVIDQQSAVEYLAPFFGIDDPAAALQRLQQEGGAADDALTAALLQASSAQPAAPKPGGSETGIPPGHAAPAAGHAPPPEPGPGGHEIPRSPPPGPAR